MPEMTLFIWNLFLLVKDVSKIYVACKARLDTEREKGGRVYIWEGDIYRFLQQSHLEELLFSWAKTEALTSTGDMDFP